MKDNIIIVGAFHEIIELVQDNNIKICGLIDNIKTGAYMNYPVLGTDNDMDKLFISYGKNLILITPDKPSIREELYNLYSKAGFSFKTLVSKESKISDSATIGIGSIVQYGVKVSCESIIGRFVKLNYNCNITHNVEIGDFTTIAPNAVLLGNVKVGRNCYVGANATVLPNVVLGDNVIIGAGSVVTKYVVANTIVKGVPAK